MADRLARERFGSVRGQVRKDDRARMDLHPADQAAEIPRVL